MEVQVDDDDDRGARDAKSAWWSTDDEAWQRPERFGRVRLGPRYAGEEESFASFEGLGDLSGGERASFATGTDQWGSVVVGASEGAAGQEAVRWTRAWGLHGLGHAPSVAHGVGPSGAWIVGTATGGPEGAIALWRGTQLAEFRRGAEVFPGGPPMFALTLPHVVLDDATIYASCIQYAAYGERLGCRVDGPGRITLTLPTSEIFAADARGTLAGVRYGGRREPIGSVAMLNGAELGHPGDVRCVIPHACRSEVRAYADAGALAVGTARVPPPGATDDADPAQLIETGFVYSASDGMRRPSDLEGGPEASAAYAISADGALIAGSGTNQEGRHAVLWIERAPRTLRDVALAAGATIPDGWRLLEVIAMSADGRVLVGNGTNPSGAPEGYRLELPRAR